MPAPFNVGPEGLLLIWAVIVSVLVALLAWRRVKLDFQADIVAPNETVTNRAHRATYHRSAECTHWFGYR